MDRERGGKRKTKDRQDTLEEKETNANEKLD